MRLRQEQLVFCAALLVLGGMSWKLFARDSVALRGRGRSEGDKALEHYSAFVELWKDADTELQPRVRDVRGRIERLQRRRG